jgi:hypothetical protein
MPTAQCGSRSSGFRGLVFGETAPKNAAKASAQPTVRMRAIHGLAAAGASGSSGAVVLGGAVGAAAILRGVARPLAGSARAPTSYP